MFIYHGRRQLIRKLVIPTRLYSINFLVIQHVHHFSGMTHLILVNFISFISISKLHFIFNSHQFFASTGFSNSSKTWLPVAANYTLNNVKLQQSQAFSHLKVFKKLLTLRKNPAFEFGDLEIQALDDDLLVYKRELKSNADGDIFVIVLNLGLTAKPVELQTIYPNLPNKLEVVLTSVQSKLLITG